MDIEVARQLVIADQRLGDTENSTDEELLAYARDTITLMDPSPPGAVTLDDDGSELAEAYRIVLSAS